jgi:hypothetical protein
MRNATDICYSENQNAHFMFHDFFSENYALYVMRKNMVEPDKPQMEI